MKKKTHNLHLYVPEALWRQVKARARLTGATHTSVVVDALRRFLKKPTPRVYRAVGLNSPLSPPEPLKQP